MIRRVNDAGERSAIARRVLEALPDWFEVKETREADIRECAGLELYAAFDGDEPVGFLALRQTGWETVEIAVMGVRPEWHHQGVGRALFEEGRCGALRSGYEFMQVKTVKEGVYPEYDATNRFYRAMGFKAFEVFPTLWDEANPCQVYVMALRREGC